jgi:hypothetical protein
MLGRFRGIPRKLCALATAMPALAGCGGSSAPATSEVVLQAEQGPFEGTLMIDPNPPHVGQHHVIVVLSGDPDGHGRDEQPLEGATVRLSPWMPAHGHGSTDVEAVEAEPGVYVAEDVWLNMPGIWDLRVHVDANDADQGDLVATVEVP